MDHNTQELLKASKNGEVEIIGRLIAQGVDVNSRDQHNWQAIHCAARNGHNNIIELLVTTGRVNADSPGYQNQTPLHYAVRNKHFSTIELLLLMNANCNIHCGFGETPLHSCIFRFCQCCYRSSLSYCEYRDKINDSPLICNAFKNLPQMITRKCVFIAIAALMISRHSADISIRSSEGRTVLERIPRDYFEQLQLRSYLETLAFEYISYVRSIQKKDQSVNLRSIVEEIAVKKNVTTQLHKASFNGDLTELKRLIFDGFDVNAKDSEGNTSVHKAVEKNNPQVLIFLLENGANINAVNDKMKSALHFAVNKTAVECLEIMLRRNCDVNLRDLNGHTAIIDAVSKTESVDLFMKSRQEKILEMLAAQNVNLSLPAENGLNCAHFAAKYGNVFAVNLLVSRDKSLLTTRDKFGNQPLHHAAIEGQNVVIEELLKTEVVGLNDVGLGNCTPLHLAVIHSKFSTIELLIMKNANCNKLDDSSCTPLHYVMNKLNNCCFGNIGECEARNKLEDCTVISAIFNAFQDSLRKKCSYLALAEFLITKGSADILIKDSKGRSPITTIKCDPLDLNYIVSYFALLYCRNMTEIKKELSQIQYAPKKEQNNSMTSFNIKEEVVEKLSSDIQSLQRCNSQLSHEIESLRSLVQINEEQIQRLKDDPNNIALVSSECGTDFKKDLFAALHLSMKKDSEILELREDIAKLKSTVKDKEKEEEILRARNELLESLVCCAICKKGQKSFKLLCGHEMCDDCYEMHKNCPICDQLK